MTRSQARAPLVWLGSVRAWVTLCKVWAAIIVLSHRRELDPDAFSYLQMAARAANGDFPQKRLPSVLCVLKIRDRLAENCLA